MKRTVGNWKRVGLSLGILVLITGLMLMITQVLLPKQKHDRALALLKAGAYEDAYTLLRQLGDEAAIANS